MSGRCVVDAGSHQYRIQRIGVLAHIIRGDARRQCQCLVPDPIPEHIDLFHVGLLTRGNAGGGNDIHPLGCNAGSMVIVDFRHRALFLESCSAEIQAVPATLFPGIQNFTGLSLVVRCSRFIDTGIVRPVTVNTKTLLFELGKTHKCILAGDSKKVQSQPDIGVHSPDRTDNRQESVDAKIVVDQEHSGDALLNGDGNVSARLVLVKNMNNRKYREPGDIELLLKL